MYQSVRGQFVDFFKEKGHEHVPSSNLVLKEDPSLLFVNSGMVQFKSHFLGKTTPSCQRAVTVQKCIRAGGKHNDLENVGYTNRHHTFFEMLGNFSFGDYFKEEAILNAWTFLTKDLSLNKEKLFITVFDTDVESEKIWKKLTGWSDDRIIKISSSDNFWSMGDIGPCGPCTEIFYDYGDSVPGGKPGTAEQDGARFTEIWNIVFMQYEKLAGRDDLMEMSRKSIDTGMGLERIASVLEGKIDNYETSLFVNLINMASDVMGIKYLINDDKNRIAFRVIVDHIRSICFLIAEGITLSNEHRGYVLRRITRRVLRYMHFLGCKSVGLARIADGFVTEMGLAFPELVRARELIIQQITDEEERFGSLLQNGISILENEMKDVASGGLFSGQKAFFLYDTYGFPLDLVDEIVKQSGLGGVDEKNFDACMDEQKRRSKDNQKVGSSPLEVDEFLRGKVSDVLKKASDISKSVDDISERVNLVFKRANDVLKKMDIASNLSRKVSDISEMTNDVLQKVNTFSTVDGFLHDKESCLAKVRDVFDINDVYYVVLDRTTIYPTGGGQEHDTGMIDSCQVSSCCKVGGVIFHVLNHRPSFGTGDSVNVSVDVSRRDACRRAHSGTHVLHYFLRKRFGNSLAQKGSLVEEDRLRLDFSLNKAITPDEICDLEREMNSFILNSRGGVCTEVTTADDAFAKGAIGLFGEKYIEDVRMVSIGDSIELCGGTHVRRESDIGCFKIVSESSISSGIRRIEAVVGLKAFSHLQSMTMELMDIRKELKMPKVSIDEGKKEGGNTEATVLDKVVETRKQLSVSVKQLASLKISNLVSKSVKNNDVLFLDIDSDKEDVNASLMKDILTKMKEEFLDGLSVCVLRSKYSKKASVGFATGVKSIKYNAKDIGDAVMSNIGGKGGGKKDFCIIGNIELPSNDADFGISSKGLLNEIRAIIDGAKSS